MKQECHSAKGKLIFETSCEQKGEIGFIVTLDVLNLAAKILIDWKSTFPLTVHEYEDFIKKSAPYFAESPESITP